MRRKLYSEHARKVAPCLGRRPASCNFHPLGETTALLALDIHDIRIASTSAADTVLLHRVGVRPVLVLFESLLLVLRGHFEPGNSGQLTGRSVGGTVLDGGVAVAKVTEVVDIGGRQEGTCGKGVNRRITPLR